MPGFSFRHFPILMEKSTNVQYKYFIKPTILFRSFLTKMGGMNFFTITCEGCNVNGRAVPAYIKLRCEYTQAFCPEGRINTDDF